MRVRLFGYILTLYKGADFLGIEKIDICDFVENKSYVGSFYGCLKLVKTGELIKMLCVRHHIDE